MSDFCATTSDDTGYLKEKLLYLENRTSQIAKLNQELEQNQMASLREMLEVRELELNNYELEMTLSEQRLHQTEAEINDLHKQIADLALQQSALEKEQRVSKRSQFLPLLRAKIALSLRSAASASKRYLGVRSIRWAITFFCFIGLYLFFDVLCYGVFGIKVFNRVSRKSRGVSVC
ncbi:uncharacterized protein LOC129585922 isoform X2 [Paramacrobiotus metropolitanus]|uniref:uncharacterized protein LOC129585922 isoform X2 n=1 Tax=Paramacrobiotus metropolitanus TaxID=2943436 RepID=UPI002445FED4|nr:uncharacterized protein LOC129585922 isoform X2 [Paramacrobiotus metropolitanus]